MSNLPINGFNLEEINSPLGFISALRRIWQLSEEHCLPAIVREYDRESHIAKVVPLVNKVFRAVDGSTSKERMEVSVPVFSISHGIIDIDIPIKQGDTGYLLACDRRCDKAIEQNSFEAEDNKGPLDPDDFSIGTFSSGFFLPCSWKKSKYSSEDGAIISVGNDITIKLIDGDIKISCPKAEEIEIVSDIRYDIETHQLQKKIRKVKKFGDFIFDISEPDKWTLMEGGQADMLEIE